MSSGRINFFNFFCGGESIARGFDHSRTDEEMACAEIGIAHPRLVFLRTCKFGFRRFGEGSGDGGTTSGSTAPLFRRLQPPCMLEE